MRISSSKCLIVGALACPTWAVLGQGVNPIDQVDTLKRREQPGQLLREDTALQGEAPELFIGEMKDVGPQSIVKVKQRRKYIEAGADSQFFYSSNIFLEEDHETDSTLFVNTAHIALAPTPYPVGQGLLEPRVGFRYVWFNYGLEDSSKHLGDFDFDTATVFTDLRYHLPSHWTVELGFDWTRLLGHQPSYGDYPEFYKEYVPRWAVLKDLFLSETKVFTIGYQGNYRFSDTPDQPNTGLNDRTDQTFLLTYSHALTPHLVLQPFYRFQFTHYTDQDNRHDFFHSAGLSVNYFFNDQISLRAFASYEHRDSDDPVQADYDKVDAGLGLNLILRF